MSHADSAVQKKARFYFVNRSDFLAHTHVHRIKVKRLNAEGIPAELVAFVKIRDYLRSKARYENARATYGAKIVLVPYKRLVPLWTFFYFAAKQISYPRIVAHLLQVNPNGLFLLRSVVRPFGRRLVCIYEFEGDTEAEADYMRLHPYREGFYERVHGITQSRTKKASERERAIVARADGMVLRSPAHIALWEERLARKIRAVPLPDLFDPDVFVFKPAERERLRKELGFGDKIVFVYSGNVVASWQKFGSICRFLKEMRGQGLNVFLLALVHQGEHDIARGFLEKHDVSPHCLLRSVTPPEMPGYLSAADIAMFLREHHLMNLIVTSSKLGEYLACGLPLLTTGANAYYNDFIKANEAGLFVTDLEHWSGTLNSGLTQLAARGKDVAWRAELSQNMQARYGRSADAMLDYVRFIRTFAGQ
jgi:glycosyltransferase involved in cell wall biosynthesis